MTVTDHVQSAFGRKKCGLKKINPMCMKLLVTNLIKQASILSQNT